MRIAAVALLAFAFGRPFFRQRDQASAAARRPAPDRRHRARPLAQHAVSGRWTAARDSALAVVRSLGPRDQVALVTVTFDAAAEVALAPTEDRALAEATLQKTVPGSAGTRLAPGLRLARRDLGKVRGADRELVVISDFSALVSPARSRSSCRPERRCVSSRYSDPRIPPTTGFTASRSIRCRKAAGPGPTGAGARRIEGGHRSAEGHGRPRRRRPGAREQDDHRRAERRGDGGVRSGLDPRPRARGRRAGRAGSARRRRHAQVCCSRGTRPSA